MGVRKPLFRIVCILAGLAVSQQIAKPATVFGAALSAGSVGLYQVAIQVPQVPDGDWPIQVSIGGATSPSGVLLSVHQ